MPLQKVSQNGITRSECKYRYPDLEAGITVTVPSAPLRAQKAFLVKIGAAGGDFRTFNAHFAGSNLCASLGRGFSECSGLR